MRLYGSSASPYTRKVRVVALEGGVALELEAADAHAIPSGYGRINPVNRIPAMRLEDGLILFDSRVICEYLDASNNMGLLPPTGAARWAVLRRQALGEGLLDAAVPRLSETWRPREQQSSIRLAKYERSIRQILDALDDDTPAAGQLDLGTIAVGCALKYLDFRFPDDQWRRGRPRLERWCETFAERPSMIQTAPTLPYEPA